MANGGIIGPTNDPISLTVSAPGTAVNFTSSGTFTPFSAPAAAADFRTANVLAIAGGRGGGTNINSGGGAGFFQYTPAHSIPGSAAPIVIGGGGSGGSGNGGASTAGFSSPVAAPTGVYPPHDIDGTGTYVAGGATGPTGTRNGGGGSSSNGGPGVGEGGNGTAAPGTGTAVKAGGGGGGAYPGQPAGGGGSGGAGSGTSSLGASGSAGSDNTGSGGGGGGGNGGSGGAGGSGFVAIKELDINVESASGIWGLSEQYQAQKAGTWPS